MVVVVFGDEQRVVEHPHRLSEPRVERRARDERRVVGVESLDEYSALSAEATEQLREVGAVVASLVRRAIGEVSGAQPFGTALEIIQTPEPQYFEIEQVSDVLLNRPAIADARR